MISSAIGLLNMLKNSFSSIAWLGLLLSASHVNGQAQEFSKLYKPGTSLHVFAPDGLPLKDKAGDDGVKINTILYGSVVVVQADAAKPVPVTTDSIPGCWVKVKSGELDGYIFDGYLSRWASVADREGGTGYLNKISRVKTTNKKAPTPSVRDYMRITYENGVIYESRIFQEGSATSITFPRNAMTLQETFLLAKALFPNYRNTICSYNPAGIRCRDGNRVINIKREGLNCVIKEEVKEE